jgi:hypothetical protein
MPIFFNENELTDEQRARYDWAVAEYARIQTENRAQLKHNTHTPVEHQISPQSALFARLLEGKPALPYPPPTSYSYPWYDIIEKPGQYHVSICAPWSTIASPTDIAEFNEGDKLILNQCAWTILRKNASGAAFLSLLRQVKDPQALTASTLQGLKAALADKPEFILGFGQWGEFRLFLGRIIRRGRRRIAINSQFDINTLDGGNPLIVQVLHRGVDIRAKSDAMLAKLDKSRQELSVLEQITFASERAILRSGDPEGDDLVEYDCDGWVLERL